MAEEQQRDAIAQPPQGQSFMERKKAQLSEERVSSGTNMNDPLDAETETSAPLRDEESVQDDGYPELHDGEERQDEDAEPDEDLDDETPLAAEADGEPEQAVNWEKRYKDTQSELERLRVRDTERDDEIADQLSGAVRLHHDLDDQLNKARSYTNFYIEGVDQRMQQLSQAFNTGMIEPDKLPEARQQYQQLAFEKQQLEQRVTQIDEEQAEAKKVRKKREAEIARVRLQRTIPGWGQEKYAQMRQEAARRGYTAQEFGEITDHRFFEMLHDSMTLRGAEKTVERVTERTSQRKPKGGRGRVSRQSRDNRGRFEKRQKEFRDNPNQPGRFAAMAEERLRRERSR